MIKIYLNLLVSSFLIYKAIPNEMNHTIYLYLKKIYFKKDRLKVDIQKRITPYQKIKNEIFKYKSL